MRRLIKNQEGQVAELFSADSTEIPAGWSLVQDEEMQVVERARAIENMMGRIRSRRDAMMVANDKAYVIASKRGESIEAIQADAQILRDLPTHAESDLANLVVKSDIEAYDPFPSLGLSRSYE